MSAVLSRAFDLAPLGRPQASMLARGTLTAVLATVMALIPSTSISAATPRTFYVNCSSGNDNNAGTSTSSPWRTLVKANTVSLLPGDSLLLKRGCTWTGPLKARWVGTASQPIRIGAYGTGKRPTIQNYYDQVDITGSYLLMENLRTRTDAPGYDPGCQNAPAGWRTGFRFRSGASYNTVRSSVVTEMYVGAYLGSGSHHNRILNNTFTNNNMKDANVNSDAGAAAIEIYGDDNEIANNKISGSDVCSRWYAGRDGSAVSIFGGQRNYVHHNDAWENNNFIEFGQSRTSDTTVAYNKVASTLAIATFLVTRGPSDPYGPVARTRAYNNSVYLSGSKAYAIICGGGCGPGILVFKNNIVWSEDIVGYSDAAFAESNNIYWRANGAPKVYFPMGPGSRKVDPKFVGLANWNFRLGAGSPAIDAGSVELVNVGLTRDFWGDPVPAGGGVDIGMDEQVP